MAYLVLFVLGLTAGWLLIRPGYSYVGPNQCSSCGGETDDAGYCKDCKGFS